MSGCLPHQHQPAGLREAFRVASGVVLRRRCLAAATDPDRVCLRLDPSSEDGKLRVVSLAPRPRLSEWEESFLHLAPQRLIIEVEGPASLSIHVGRFGARYDRGRYTADDPRSALSSLIPRGISDVLVAECRSQSRRRERCDLLHGIGTFDEGHHLAHEEQFVAELAAGAPLVAADTVYFIAAYANRFRHGAILLMTTLSEPDQMLKGLDPRFILCPCSEPAREWNAGVLDYLWWVSVVRLAQVGVSVLTPCDVPALRDWAASEGEFSVFRAREAWHRDAKNAAQLSQIDGVTVFDSQLRPCILGGHVAEVDIRDLPSEWHAFLEKRGSRHKSGAFLAYKNPGTLCIVVSQDGTLTAFSCDSSGAAKFGQVHV